MTRSEKKKLDGIWAEIIKKPGYCLRCGATHKKLEAAHIVGRGAYATRWRLDNGLCLCFTCHADYDQHRNYGEDWVRAYVGQEKWDELQREGRVTGRKYFYDEILSTLKP
jgi:hypothetical protein